MPRSCRAGRCASWWRRRKCSTTRAATSTSVPTTGRRRSARRSPRREPGWRRIRKDKPRLPIAWKISTDERLVLARADGPVTLQEITDYLDPVLIPDAHPYAKLFYPATIFL